MPAPPELREEPPPRLVPGELEPNPLGLPAEVCQELTEALDRDVATLLLLFHQYKKHAWTAMGAEAEEVRAVLHQHAARCLRDADALAERVAALGGVVTANPANLEALASVPPEHEGVTTLRVMLQHDLRAQEQAVRDLRRHARLAEELGDPGTGHLLREALLAHEQMAHALHRTLADESLVVGIARRRFGLREVPQPAPPDEAEGRAGG